MNHDSTIRALGLTPAELRTPSSSSTSSATLGITIPSNSVAFGTQVATYQDVRQDLEVDGEHVRRTFLPLLTSLEVSGAPLTHVHVDGTVPVGANAAEVVVQVHDDAAAYFRGEKNHAGTARVYVRARVPISRQVASGVPNRALVDRTLYAFAPDVGTPVFMSASPFSVEELWTMSALLQHVRTENPGPMAMLIVSSTNDLASDLATRWVTFGGQARKRPSDLFAPDFSNYTVGVLRTPFADEGFEKLAARVGRDGLSFVDPAEIPLLRKVLPVVLRKDGDPINTGSIEMVYQPPGQVIPKVATNISELHQLLVPKTTELEVEQLGKLIRDSQKSPPADKHAFIKQVNEILVATSLALWVDGKPARLCVTPKPNGNEFIQFVVAHVGRRGFQSTPFEVRHMNR